MAKKQKQAKEKPLEKMTATELREVAKGISEITGASGMNKDELVAEIQKARGIEVKSDKKKPSATIRQIKEKIEELKDQRETYLKEDNAKMAAVVRRRISRLKKQTRKNA